ncbi:MAG: DHA2 family efflux MFS transporter permease subunit [Casimicrobiaceae bacterium]
MIALVRKLGARAGGGTHRGLITASVMLASVMQSLDTTIANVALPHIQGSLSATQDQMTWVLTSYIVASAIMIPLSGWLAGQFGRKRVFLISIALFTLASALCGMAQTLPELVAFRLLQGMGGAALIPLSQAVLLDINPRERHGRAMAIWGMGVVMGPILGPALGGWLTEDYNWRWVFYINVPIGILSFLGMLAFLAESERQRSRFDFFGFTTLSLAVGALQMMLDRGQLKDWFSSTEIWIEAAVAGVALYLFIVHTLTSDRPFVNPALFRDRNFVTGNVFIFIVGLVLFATLALMPPLLQDLLKYPVITTGLVTAPRGIGTLLAMMIVGRLVGRMDVRLIIAFGFLLTAWSLWQMTGFSLLMDSSLIIWSGVIQGIGTGFAYVPLAAVAFATLAPRLRNEGTAVFNLMRNIGSSIGISVVQIMLTRNTQIVHSTLAEHVTPYSHFLPSQIGPDGWTSAQGLAALNHRVTEQAAMIAYNDDFQMMLMLTLCVIPLVVVLRDVRARNGAPVAID